MMASWEIYTLSDPRTLRARYVGVTTRGEVARYGRHLYAAIKGRTHVANWIRSLLRLGYRPIYLVLEYGEGLGWQDRERWWIATHRKFCDLTNATDGGEGTPGRIVSSETRSKQSTATKGKPGHPSSPETRARMRLAMIGNMNRRGQQTMPEHRAKLSLAGIGHVVTPETRLKIREAQLGKRLSFETRAKMSASLLIRYASPEARAKLSAARRGTKRSPLSVEHRAKISAANKGKSWSVARRNAQGNRVVTK